MAKRKLPKTSKARAHHKVKKVKLPKDVVLRVEAHPDVVPMVVASAPGVVDIVAAPKEVAKQQSWFNYWFGE